MLDVVEELLEPACERQLVRPAVALHIRVEPVHADHRIVKSIDVERQPQRLELLPASLTDVYVAASSVRMHQRVDSPLHGPVIDVRLDLDMAIAQPVRHLHAMVQSPAACRHLIVGSSLNSRS